MPVRLQKDSFEHFYPQILPLISHIIVRLVGGGLNISCNKGGMRGMRTKNRLLRV